ncbi:MAG: hypothetical protein WAZ19_11765 [Anaerolineae bacterium]
MILSNAQLAVILELALGDEMPLDAAARRDLGVTVADLADARAGLIETGYLLPNGPERYAVAPDVADMLATAFAPEQLFVLQVQDRDQTKQQISYSHAGAAWTRYTLPAPNRHEFTALASADAVVDSLLTDTHTAKHSAGAAPRQVAPLVEVLRRAVRLGLLITGPLPGRDRQPVALSWVAATDGLWWINPAGPPETAQRCTAAELRDKLAQIVG